MPGNLLCKVPIPAEYNRKIRVRNALLVGRAFFIFSSLRLIRFVASIMLAGCHLR